MLTLTPHEFVDKWKQVTGRERQTYQEHFLNLVHKRLNEAVFAAYGWKSDLTDEEILSRLLELNLERAK